MRITEASRYQSFLQDVSRAQDRLVKAQRQVSSGKRVAKPSDDPGATTDILRLNSDKSESGQYSKNLTFARSKLQTTDGVLDTIEQIVERARVLGLSSLSNPAAAKGYATETTALRDQLFTSANTTFAGRYIFGGSVTTTAPYVKNPDSSITYAGDGEHMPLEIGHSLTIQTQIPGSDLFNGPVDIFSTLSDLAAAMQAGDKASMDAQVQKIEQFTDVMSVARSKVGGYLNLATSVETNMSSANVAREKVLSEEEAADLAAAISELTTSQNALQATLSVGARLSELNIWNFLK
jgi:flagellar hook-associated protein 3 FlgL